MAVRVGSLGRTIPRTGLPPSAAGSHLPGFHPRALSLSLSLSPRLGYRRRPTPGAEVFVDLFAGDEHTKGIPAPSLPFLMCETEHPNHNLSYLAI